MWSDFADTFEFYLTEQIKAGGSAEGQGSNSYWSAAIASYGDDRCAPV